MRIVVAVCCVIAFGITKNVEAQKREVLSSFCQLSLSEELKQSDTSFTDSFTFKIDQNGKPYQIKRLLGKYVSDHEVKSCLGKWNFSGFVENSRVSIYFSWKHGIGWEQMRIISKDFSQVVVKGSKSCPDSSNGKSDGQ